MHTQPSAPLLTSLGQAFAAHAPQATSGQWSAVNNEHAGRVETAGRFEAMPRGLSEVFWQIHHSLIDAEQGAPFSLHAEVDASGGVEFRANFTERVFWNSPDFLTPPPGQPPVPSDDAWVRELNRHPRSAEFLPDWVPATGPTSEFTQLRQALADTGVPLELVRLPGESHTTFEGAILVRETGGMYSVDVFDYGQLHHLTQVETQREAGVFTWNYLTSHMPAHTDLSTADIATRLQASQGAYQELGLRIHHAGVGGVVTNLAPGALYDRWGEVDGLYIFPWETPLPQRSLPPSAVKQPARRVGFLALQPVPVQAEFAPEWFDQPGGGIRFRLSTPMRDLVRSGAISVVRATS